MYVVLVVMCLGRYDLRPFGQIPIWLSISALSTSHRASSILSTVMGATERSRRSLRLLPPLEVVDSRPSQT